VIAYLCAAVRNQALDFRRREGTIRRTAAQGAPPPAALPTPEPQPESDVVEALRVAFFTLPEHYRVALQMRYGQRLGYTEVAAALSLTPKGAERLIARAVAALRRLLKAE
jgi:RNA polymerase sigma factor (sigma-70 family)